MSARVPLGGETDEALISAPLMWVQLVVSMIVLENESWKGKSSDEGWSSRHGELAVTLVIFVVAVLPNVVTPVHPPIVEHMIAQSG